MDLRPLLVRSVFAAAPIIAIATLAACDQAKPVYVDGAYVRLSPNPDNPSAAYFTIHGGSQPVTLRAVETDAAVRLEMHESTTHDGGMATMAPLETVDVPARLEGRISNRAANTSCSGRSISRRLRQARSSSS